MKLFHNISSVLNQNRLNRIYQNLDTKNSLFEQQSSPLLSQGKDIFEIILSHLEKKIF